MEKLSQSIENSGDSSRDIALLLIAHWTQQYKQTSELFEKINLCFERSNSEVVDFYQDQWWAIMEFLNVLRTKLNKKDLCLTGGKN
jgi:hypothetical protein